MERLEEDMVIEILVRLPVKSIMQCRCVSKSWLQLTNNPLFINLHFNRTLSLQIPHTNFILSNLSVVQKYYVTPLFNLEYNETLHDYNCNVIGFAESQPEFLGLRVMGSCNGLICLAGDDRASGIHISNPFTRHSVKLPDPIDYSRDTAVGFGFVSKKNQYKLVTIRNVVDKSRSDRAVVYVFALGDVSWRFLEIISHKVNWEVFPKQVLVNGALHWLSHSRDNTLIVYDVASEVVRFMLPPKVDFSEYPSLGVLDGCLSLTGFLSSFRHAEIWVMKDYGVHKSWTKCYNVDFNSIGLNNRGLVLTICLEKDGELLMLYRLKLLVSYDVRTTMLRKIPLCDVRFPGFFEVIDHVPTLVAPFELLKANGD